MAILKFCFYFLTLLSYPNINKTRIVVIGEAQNLKGGATVLSKEDNKRYFVGELASWDENIVGKTVKVSGKLYVINHEPPRPGEPEKQRMIGEQRIILKPKWELVK